MHCSYLSQHSNWNLPWQHLVKPTYREIDRFLKRSNLALLLYCTGIVSTFQNHYNGNNRRKGVKRVEIVGYSTRSGNPIVEVKHSKFFGRRVLGTRHVSRELKLYFQGICESAYYTINSGRYWNIHYRVKVDGGRVLTFSWLRIISE